MMNPLYPLDMYVADAYMLPYWDSDIIYQEAVLVLENENSSIPDMGLLYHADRILSVRSSDLQTEYREGKDYTLVNGKLHIPEGSSIPTVTHSFYYPDQGSDHTFPLNKNYGEGYIFFSEGPWMHTLQIAVTYTHSDRYTGTVPVYKGDRLPKTKAKLENGEALRLAVFGDSISTGANSSGRVKAAPMAQTWFQMFADRLAQTYRLEDLALHNPSVGGKTSGWGVEVAAEAVGYGPDLCIIGFGMNDGTKNVPTETYRQNIRAIMDAALAGNPNCEFILLATILPNAEVKTFLGNQADYLPVLLSMEAEGVVVADMTTVHRHLLTRKRYCDMTGNNVNHPNDFLARVYAHVLWQTVVGY